MDQSETMRVTVEEAARLLGIEKGSVKKRIQRGKLRSERDAGGTVYVFVDRSETVRDKSQGQSETSRDTPSELVDQMQQRIDDLREQLREEREAHRESRRIIAGLVQRIPELEAPTDTSAPTQQSERGAESAGEGAGSGTGTPGPEGSSENQNRRPWWRRAFGISS